MKKLMSGIGGLVASTVAAFLCPDSWGMTGAFLVSTIAGGFGMYYGAKWAKNNFG